MTRPSTNGIRFMCQCGERAIARVQEMIAERQPVAVVLDAIAGAKGKR